MTKTRMLMVVVDGAEHHTDQDLRLEVLLGTERNLTGSASKVKVHGPMIVPDGIELSLGARPSEKDERKFTVFVKGGRQYRDEDLIERISRFLMEGFGVLGNIEGVDGAISSVTVLGPESPPRPVEKDAKTETETVWRCNGCGEKWEYTGTVVSECPECNRQSHCRDDLLTRPISDARPVEESKKSGSARMFTVQVDGGDVYGNTDLLNRIQGALDMSLTSCVVQVSGPNSAPRPSGEDDGLTIRQMVLDLRASVAELAARAAGEIEGEMPDHVRRVREAVSNLRSTAKRAQQRKDAKAVLIEGGVVEPTQRARDRWEGSEDEHTCVAVHQWDVWSWLHGQMSDKELSHLLGSAPQTVHVQSMENAHEVGERVWEMLDAIREPAGSRPLAKLGLELEAILPPRPSKGEKDKD